MKITMYELLGMVKDGKELPKKVKVFDVIYAFDDHYGDYFNEELDRYLFVYMASGEEWKLAYFLNTQVEILEEEKKIPEKINKSYDIRILDLDKPHTIKDYDMEQLIEMVQDIYGKQCEIIDYLKIKGDE